MTSDAQKSSIRSAPRVIRLRRPAVLIPQEGPFVPQAGRARLDEVEPRWEALRAANPAYFDGRLYHVLGVHRNGHGGASLHVIDCAYRFHAVQDQCFDLGVRPLGVKGITMHDGRVLLGRRSSQVNAYRGLWEFAPGGVVEPGHDPAQTVRMELREEAGMELGAEPTAIALVFDAVLWSWELIYRLAVGTGETMPRQSEYTELDWFDPDKLPAPLSPLAEQMIPLLGAYDASRSLVQIHGAVGKTCQQGADDRAKPVDPLHLPHTGD